MHTVTRVGDLDVIVKPSPVAMVWNEPGRAHDALAAPGVRLAPGEAVVEVELATICGADVRVVRGEQPAPAPLVLGHEQVGRVVAIGEGARRVDGVLLGLGDRVVWSTTVSCGECDRCTRGVSQACRTLGRYGHERVHRGWELSGGFATHVQLRRGTAIVRAPEDVPSRVLAPAACTAATAVAALEAASTRLGLDGALILVTGAGLVGLTVAAMAIDAGAEVIVSDPDASRRELVRRFGAVPVDPGARSTSSGGLAAARAEFERRGLGEVHVAVEASGAAAAVRSSIDALGTGGVAVLVGHAPRGSEVCLDPESLVRRLVTIQSVRDASGEQLRRAVAFLERSWRSFPFDELVGSTHPLADLDRAIDEAATGRHLRVGVAPGRRHV
ncbi:alcohol dehydrogenase catalytic domain-containing protein [Agromyces sp. H66]|uniref:alcohol dehydrogenase catalytic domain-containing protein n=1 Tax=Agromyces sp. H66 TaxID=2529859 RepID=UPI0010AB4090|nr:alcohol dehydrogenase catalytic domain-containing protein [Agromyces sp. H66]